MTEPLKGHALDFRIFNPDTTNPLSGHAQPDQPQSIHLAENSPPPAPTVGTEQPTPEPTTATRPVPTSELLLDLHQQAIDAILLATEATAARLTALSKEPPT